MKKRVQLPKTSRVNDKIIEYWQKFGRERDLDKYMRLYSPSGSQRSSGGAHSSCATPSDTATNSSCCATAVSTSHTSNADTDTSGEGKVLRQLFQQKSENQLAKQKESKHSSRQHAKQRELQYFTMEVDVHCSREIIIPIELEQTKPKSAEGKTSVDKALSSASADEMRTPLKQTKESTTIIPTPESVTKSHKRLEWDSLGDVGYKKSSSTSNISTLERTLLKEFFLESTLNEQCNKTKTNASESDLKRLQNESKTPPLASSTFVDAAIKDKGTSENADLNCGSVDGANKGARIKRQLATQACQTITKRVHDQSAQTSARPQLTRPEMVTHSVQATLTTNSCMGSSATPSSFEYFSSRSSTTSNATRSHMQRQQQRAKSQKEPNSYITQVSEMLAQRQRQGMPKQQHEHQQPTPETLINENKENLGISNKSSIATSGDSIKMACTMEACAPELDLGIQLLCSLVDAKSLNNSQKKQFIRDIAKRISYVGGISSTNTSSSASIVRRNRHKYSTNNGSPRRNTGENHCQINLRESAGSLRVSLAQTAAQCTTSNENDIENSAVGDTNAVIPTVDAISMTTINPKSSASSIRNTTTTESSRSSTASKEVLTQKLNAAVVVPAQVIVVKDANTELKQATMREWLNPMTQSEIDYEEKHRNMAKAALKSGHKMRKQHNQHINTENSEDRERRSQLNWVESEINRLEGLRLLLSKVTLNPTLSDDPQFSSSAAATTIDTAPSVSNNTTSQTSGTGQSLPEVNTQAETRIYDSVNSDQEIEITIEGSIGKCLGRTPVLLKQIIREIPDGSLPTAAKTDLHWPQAQPSGKPPQKPKHPTEQSVPAAFVPPVIKPHHPLPADSIDPDLRGHHSKVQTTLFPTAPNAGRSKLPTPKSSHSSSSRSGLEKDAGDGRCSESVCSFVQQRKREFMEHYNSKKREQLELLMQHEDQKRKRQENKNAKEQQRRLKQLTPQQQQQQRQRQTVRQPLALPPCQLYKAPHYCAYHYQQPAMCASHAHYQQSSQQQPRPCNCASEPLAETQHYYHVVPPAAVVLPKKCSSSASGTSGIVNMAATCLPAAETASAADASNVKHTEYGHQQNSTVSATTSSLLCMTSDVSVPMGTRKSEGRRGNIGICIGEGTTTSSSATTTTHQYDDVAAAVAGIGVQTSGSMRRTQPIYATAAAAGDSASMNGNALPRTGKNQTACVQVRPRGIAYVIEFANCETSTGSGDGGDSADINIIAERAAGGASGTTTVDNVAAMQALTLQDYLQRAKPKFCAQSKERKSILNTMQLLRNERRRELDDIVENTSYSSLDRKLNQLPPAPTSNVRIFSTREMKAMTSRRCQVLPEVLERQKRECEERRRRRNRMLRDVFNRRLQRRVRNGKISLNYSRTII